MSSAVVSTITRTDTLPVSLVFSGEGVGGVTVDIQQLERGIQRHGQHAVVVGGLRELRDVLKAGPHIVHVFGCLPSAATFGSMALAKVRGLPLVWTPVFHPSRPGSWKGYGFLRIMQGFDLVAPRVARFADAVIAATEQEAAYFRRLGARRTEWIPPGVAPPERGTRPNEIAAFRRRSGIEPGPVILVVGRDNSRKALPFGMSVFRELRASWPDAQMLLVGPGERYVPATRGIHSLGWLDRAELDLAFRAADVLFVPSLYEGLPRVVIEGWSYSLPVVTTDRVALAPLVGRTGKAVVPYGDVRTAASTLRAILLDTDAAARIGAAGRATVAEHFLLEDVVRRTAMLYATLARGV